MPSQPQQSVAALHDLKAVMDLVVVANDRFSRRSAEAWSGAHGTAGTVVWFMNVPDARSECATTRWVCRSSSNINTCSGWVLSEDMFNGKSAASLGVVG
jgi:hypothetical protein